IFKVFFSPVWFSCVLLLMIFVSYFFYKIGLNLDTLWIYFSDGFDFDATESSSLRKLQYVSLMDGWYESSILFGAGNGANADVIRDVNMPWAYELTYVYILFTTGLVGVIFYSFWFLWGLLRLRISLNKNANVAKYLAPIVSGVFCILIAGATNPYFNKFDYLWIVLLPHLLSDSVSYVANNEDNIRCRGF
ncbi:hypothetical protein L9W97_17695, partial [Vibrio aestuarianus]|nr:hypothetical protein [Vibrio aestuarianus]